MFKLRAGLKMSAKVNTARNVPSDKKSLWRFTAKRILLFVIGVSIFFQLAAFVSKWFTNPYGFMEFTQANADGGTGSERAVGTVVEKLEYSNASLRTAVTDGNHRTGSTEGVLSNNFSKTTDGIIVAKPVSRVKTSMQPNTLEANIARETVFLRSYAMPEAPSIVGNFAALQVPSSTGVDNEEYFQESMLKTASSAHPNFPILLSKGFKVNSHNEKLYRILIYGLKERLAQRLDFLLIKNGTWGANISCGENVTIEVHVGNATDDFEGQNAVLFNMDEVAVPKGVETLGVMQTSSKQAWIYYGREPAVRLRQMFRSCGNLPLHGVWSYQHDSEVRMTYGSFVLATPMTTKGQSDDFWSRGKTKLVAWMARNCRHTFWPRTKFVNSLKRHIPVDIYGTCGNLACPFIPVQECRNRLSKYKFYLALESAECEDYVTEKMWETALANGIVPVVYGATKSTYIRQAPPHSYIYIGDFNSTEALAEYLKMLDKKPKLYAKYFEWRYEGHIEVSKRAGETLPSSLFCSLIPFISKVEKGSVKKKKFSEFPFYKSCRLLKGKDVGPDYRPSWAYRAKHWKLNW